MNHSGRNNSPTKRIMTRSEERRRRRALAQRIRSARIAAGLTQEEFATQLHVSQGRINAYETGRAAPRAIDLPVVCASLGTDPNTLLGVTESRALCFAPRTLSRCRCGAHNAVNGDFHLVMLPAGILHHPSAMFADLLSDMPR